MSQPDLSRVTWKKSKRSEGSNACVEVARANSTIAIRDSKNPSGHVITVGATGWSVFAHALKC